MSIFQPTFANFFRIFICNGVIWKLIGLECKCLVICIISGISILQKLSKVIKEYNSDYTLDYATVQETLGTIYLITANLSQAKTHLKKAFKIYEKFWADEPEMIEAKYREIQELYSTIRQINIRIFQSDIIIRDTLLIWFSFA